jgi:hypothetical protein
MPGAIESLKKSLIYLVQEKPVSGSLDKKRWKKMPSSIKQKLASSSAGFV